MTLTAEDLDDLEKTAGHDRRIAELIAMARRAFQPSRARVSGFGLRIGDGIEGHQIDLVRHTATALLYRGHIAAGSNFQWCSITPNHEFVVPHRQEIDLIIDAPSMKEIVWLVDGVQLRATCRPWDRPVTMFDPTPMSGVEGDVK